MTHWLLVHAGITNLAGPWYGFWSGIGGDLPMFGVIGVLWRKHCCHVDHCWRLGLHHVQGSPYAVCRRHHPAVPSKVTAEHIRAASR